MLRGGVLRSTRGSPKDAGTSSSGACGPVLPLRRRLHLQTGPRRFQPLAQRIVCGSGVAHPEEDQMASSQLSAFLSAPPTAMAKNLGSTASVTLEKSKVQIQRKVRPVGPRTDDAGGGGDMGKSVFNGGGGGGDDDDDDDDYYDEEDGGEGDGDDGFFRKVLPQLYDKVTVSAVLEEWFRTVGDLPAMMRRSVEMGLFSSAQLVRFCSMDVRPGLFRSVARKLPTSMSRPFVGRLMADPAFAQKMILENVLAIGASVLHEFHTRRERFSQELDFVAINTLGLAAITSSVVWTLTPSRSFGSATKLPWQKMVGTLPNNIFDAAGPLRNYTSHSRAASLLTKCAELSAVGAVVGASTSLLSGMLLNFRRRNDPSFSPSVPIPKVEESAVGMSAFVGLHAHLRYQTIGGIDRYLFDHSSVLWSYLAASGLFRLANFSVGEMSRPWFLGQKPTRQLRMRVPSSSSQSPVQPAASVRPRKKKSRGFEMSVVSATP